MELFILRANQAQKKRDTIEAGLPGKGFKELRYRTVQPATLLCLGGKYDNAKPPGDHFGLIDVMSHCFWIHAHHVAPPAWSGAATVTMPSLLFELPLLWVQCQGNFYKLCKSPKSISFVENPRSVEFG